MKCECCHNREATMHVNDVDAWKTTNIIHTCLECAAFVLPQLLGTKGPLASVKDILVEARRQAAKSGDGEDFGDDPEDALSLFAKATEQLIPKLKCDGCGMTFAEFQKHGRFGCGTCYEAFGKMIEPALERIHGVGHTKHVGRKPGEARVSRKMAAIRRSQDLKREMDKAVSSENYERAAEIRDEIVALDGEIGSEKT